MVDLSPISFLEGRGYRRHVLSLVNALHQNKISHRYTLLSRQKTADSFLPPGDPRFCVEHPRRRISMLHRPFSWTGWAGKLFLSDVDVVHFPCTDIWYGPPRARTVVTLHDFAPLHFPEHFFKNSKEEKQYRFLLERVAQNADFLIAVSDFTRTEALKYLGVEPGRIQTVYNAVDPLFLKNSASLPDSETKRLGIEDPFFLFVGALDFRKNIPLLVKAFSWYRARGGSAHLVLVGRRNEKNPKYFPPLEPILEKTPYRKNILWLNQVSDSLLPAIYSKAIALVFPSSFEGFGYPLVEAMASGTPLVATQTSSLAEIAGEAALWTEPVEEKIGEALKRVEEDETLRKRLKEEGKERLKLFLPECLAEEMIRIYHQTAGVEFSRSARP